MFAHSFRDQPTPEKSEEIASQRMLVERLEPMRLVSSAVAFGLMTLYLPPWLTMLAMACDLSFELLGFRLMQQGVSSRRVQRAVMASVALMEISYALPCVLIWQQDDHFAKALAVGLLCLTLFQLTMVRAIHLPFGLAGWSAVISVAMLGNAYFWISHSGWSGLSLSSLGLAAAGLFTLQAMLSNHALHVEISKRGRLADAANRAKGRFLAQMSHELRTPLNAILGMGEAELALTHDPGAQERMRTLVGSARGLAVILDDILEMSALEENGVPIRPVETKPAEVIAATVALFRPLFATAGLALALNLSDALPVAVVLDPMRLRQCLANLLSNALKFTDTGGVEVRAGVSDQGLLQIEVQDSGPGIAPHVLDLAFQPFQRGVSEQTGTGLGLAISRGLARQMGGDLHLLPSSSGARFCLTLAMTPALPAAAPPPAPPLNLRGRHVLVVDDIPTNRLVAATYLRLMGASASEAASGAEAVEAIRQAAPDLVLLDMNMPGLSGLQTLTQIRALPAGALPVVAMTADASAAYRRQYLQAGLDGYLSKPLTPEAMRACLAELLPPAPVVSV